MDKTLAELHILRLALLEILYDQRLMKGIKKDWKNYYYKENN
jgi:hypothetical protein